MKTSKILLLLSLISIHFLKGQNELSKWYFGWGAGLDFMTNPPSILTNTNMGTFHGSSCISDAAGNFLAYSNGTDVYNQQGQVMANGSGLYGCACNGQSSIMIKKPASTTLYYVFTLLQNPNNGPNGGLRYSVMDMSLAAGLGSVTVKNASLFPGPCLQKVGATRHCNGTDYWVMMHEWTTDVYRSYLLTATGISTTAITSSIGISYTNGNSAGSIKFSPNGKKMASVIPAVGSGTFGVIEVFDFDAATGQLSNGFSIPIYPGSDDSEFSPDGTKLYSHAFAGINSVLLQWDLCAGSSTAIIASQYTVAVQTDTLIGFNGFQRGINGKIYLTRPGYQHLGVINNPNATGSTCNFNSFGQSVGTNICSFGLPNLVNTGKSYLNFTVDLACPTVSFSPPPTVYQGTMGCSNVVNTVLSYNWSFGDPASGALNTSSSSHPVHVYPSAGSYSAQLIITYSNSCAPDTLRQILSIVNPTLTVQQTTVSCNGLASATAAVAQGYGTGSYSYSWMPGGQTGSVVTNLSAGVQTLNVMALGGSCVLTKTVNITAPATLTALTSNTLSCSTASAEVSITNGSGTYSITWSPGNYTDAAVSSLAAGNYTVQIIDLVNQCTLSSTLQITALPAPTLLVSGNTTVCKTNTHATLTVSGADTYSWTGISSAPTITLNPSSTTVYTVSGTNSLTGCSTLKTVTLTVSLCAGIVSQSTLKDVKIYPNPVKNSLMIESPDECNYKLYNLLGNLVQEGKIENGNTILDLQKLSSGIYFLKLLNNMQENTFKVVKED